MTDRIAKSQQKADAQYFEHIQKDPVRWIQDTFGQPLFPWQRDIVLSVRDNRETHVPSCVNSGKTNVFAKIVFWWLAAHGPQAKVITTATVWDQVELQLWKEVAASYNRAKVNLGGRLLNTQFQIGPEWFAIGLSPEKSVNMQGYHSPNLLVIVDEADGVDMERFAALDSVMTSGNCKFLCGGNPINPGSEWKKRVDLARHKQGAKVRHITGDEVLKYSDTGRYPFLLQRGWVADLVDRWGTEHPYVQAKVFAQWPTQASDVLIPLAWAERAKGRKVPRGELVLSVDVARYGTNKTIRTLLRGGWLEESLATSKEDTMQTAGRTHLDIREKGPARIVVDDTGVGGGVTDRLRQLGHEVIAFTFGGRPNDDEHFVDAGSEAYWALRKAFETDTIGISMADPEVAEAIIAEVTRPIFLTDERLRIKVNKFGVRGKNENNLTSDERAQMSPDRADGLAMAWWAAREFRPDQPREQGIVERELERLGWGPGGQREELSNGWWI